MAVMIVSWLPQPAFSIDMIIDFVILSDRQVMSDTPYGEVFLAPLLADG